MTPKSVIVVYGHDQTLLDTRSWVLQGEGYQVLQALQRSDLEQAANQQPVALVVLCHTLTGEECDQSRVFLNCRPEIKRLLITANRPLSQETRSEAAVSAFDGPRALIDMVNRMLVVKTETSI